MKILADENIPDSRDFAAHGALRRLPARDITAATLADVEVLLVRSVTRVDAALLEGTPVRFVGTATIGTDHVDLEYLEHAGIRFASAPGCNAMAVAEYVLQAVLEWLCRQDRPPHQCTAGIVGLGNTGRRLAALLQALGMEVLASDPPLEAAGGLPASVTPVPLRDALAADVISLHVPLVNAGPAATRHLVDGPALDGLGAGQLLVNTSRGPVVDNRALVRRLEAGEGPDAVLDVWEGEPWVDAGLFRLLWRGTPHVAGYSVEGRRRGTRMLYRAFCRWQGLAEPEGDVEPLRASCSAAVRSWRDLPGLLSGRYPQVRDHQRLAGALEAADPAAAFMALRRDYPPRHEMAGLSLSEPPATELQPLLALLGVEIPDAETARHFPGGGRPPVSSPR